MSEAELHKLFGYAVVIPNPCSMGKLVVTQDGKRFKTKGDVADAVKWVIGNVQHSSVAKCPRCGSSGRGNRSCNGCGYTGVFR